MTKNFWIGLLLLSGFFAGGFAMAESAKPEAAAVPGGNWYVIALAGGPAICGQTRAGQFLCLHPESPSIPQPKATGLMPAHGTPGDLARFALRTHLI